MDGSGQTSREDPSAAAAAELTVSGAPEGRGERTENQRGNGGAVVFETSGAVLRGNETSTGGGGGGGNAEEETDEAKTQPRWKLGNSACVQLSKRVVSMEIASRKLFNDAREGRELTDMEFALDSGLKVRGHKSWLMARSDYIQAMLSSGMQEAQTGVVPVRQCADVTFLVLLEYLYTGKASLSSLGLCLVTMCYTTSLMALLEMFQIEGLQEEISGMTFEALTLPPGALWKAGRTMLQDAQQGAELTDMEFVLDSGLKVRGHKSWLMARCESFADKIRESTTGVVPVRECSDGGFLALLEFVYTGRLTGDTCIGQDWEELRMIAERFGMKEVGDMLMDAVTLDEAEKAAQVAVKRGMTQLAGICVKTMRPPRTEKITMSDVLRMTMPQFSKERAIIVTNVMFIICDSDYGIFEENEMFPILQDGLQTLCRAMMSQRNDAELQIRGCIALRNAARSISSSNVHDPDAWDYELVHPAKTVFAVMGALNYHKSNPQVQIHGFEALSALLVTVRISTMGESVMDGAQQDKGWLESLDGIDLILAALMIHASIAEVQAAGCQLFVQLWTNYGGRYWEDPAGPAVDDEPRIGYLIKSISTALIDHKGSVEVQRMGNAALFYLVLGADAPGSPWNESHGGVEALVEALKSTNTNNKRVHCNGTHALMELVYDEESRLRAGQAGGIEAVVKALSSDISDVQLQVDGCSAIFSLIEGSDEYRSRAGQAGAVEAVVEALKKHKKNHRITFFTCQALAELSFDHVENRRRAGQAGWVELVIDALKTHDPSDAVVKHSDFCAALSHLLLDDLNRESAVTAGGIEAVVKALGTHISDVQLQVWGCSALLSLVEGSDEYRSRAGQAGAVEAVVEALKMHKGNARVYHIALENLLIVVQAYFDNLFRRAVDAGAVEVVEEILDNQELDQGDKETCDHLLSQFIEFNSMLPRLRRGKAPESFEKYVDTESDQ